MIMNMGTVTQDHQPLARRCLFSVLMGWGRVDGPLPGTARTSSLGEVIVAIAYLAPLISLALTWVGLAVVRVRYSWAVVLVGGATGISLLTLVHLDGPHPLWFLLLLLMISVGFALAALITAPDLNRRARLIWASVPVLLIISAVIRTLV